MAAPTLGIDIGGTGIKGAPVDLDAGEFAEDRLRIATPEGGKPADVAKVVAEIVAHFDTTGPVGCTFPAVIRDGTALTAANVDDSWIGTDAADLFAQECGRPFVVVNDADAAGIAEMRHGAGKGESGVVLMLTLGTGIGSALFVDGALVPNTELGHLEVRGKDAEQRAAASVREEKDLSWARWAERLDEVIAAMERVLWPRLIILGGGVSKKSDKFVPHLKTRADVVPAQLLNAAGIIGAASAANPAE
ncbi:MAG TPA: ROK family protein [Acidimicrobiia bacterium]|nr:ROK family protein [Acidimicrobiia bacterium]